MADIKKNGLQEPITPLKSQILDRRNRYEACLNSEIPLRSVEYDPLSFVYRRICTGICAGLKNRMWLRNFSPRSRSAPTGRSQRRRQSIIKPSAPSGAHSTHVGKFPRTPTRADTRGQYAKKRPGWAPRAPTGVGCSRIG